MATRGKEHWSPPVSPDGLRVRPAFAKTPRPMSNRSIWNVQRRHEWLATPLKGKRLHRRKRARIGLEQALERKRRLSAQRSADSQAEE